MRDDRRVEELARAAAMSRTTFAVRFKEAGGMAPLQYLTAWRIRLAERRLPDETAPISLIAATLGYSPESAKLASCHHGRYEHLTALSLARAHRSRRSRRL